jgi:hypothetical protein
LLCLPILASNSWKYDCHQKYLFGILDLRINNF